VSATPLRRNRDFLLLQAGLLLSSAGSQMTSIAYPLLVLALTGSAAKAGAVAFVRFLAMAVFALPSGVAADRWDRRRLMIAAHATRACVIGTLGVLVLADEVEYWMLLLVAFVEGGGAALFSAAQSGAFRAVVPTQQLPGAVAVVTAKASGYLFSRPRPARGVACSAAAMRTPSRAARASLALATPPRVPFPVGPRSSDDRDAVHRRTSSGRACCSRSSSSEGAA
jgi:MFS family permease